MKKVFFMSLFMTMMSVGVYAQEGSKSLGASVVFGSGEFGGTNLSNTGYQAKFRYGLTDTWRVEGSFIFFTKKDDASFEFEDDKGIYTYYNISSSDFSVNLHYCHPLSEQFVVYPLAGLGYMKWNGLTPEMKEVTIGASGYSYTTLVPTGKNVDFSKSKIGFNIGAGADYQITDNISANAEFRYRPGDDPFSRTYFSIGLCYKF
jgi:outer membrane protein X